MFKFHWLSLNKLQLGDNLGQTSLFKLRQEYVKKSRNSNFQPSWPVREMFEVYVKNNS